MPLLLLTIHLTPHSSLLTPHFSLLTPHASQSLRVLLKQVKEENIKKANGGGTPLTGDECVICYEIPHKPLVLECTHGPFCEKVTCDV